jgi:hypothetical protein
LMRAPPGEPRLGGRGALASTPKVALRCGSLVTLGPTLISRCSPTPLGFRGVSCTPGFAGPCAGRPLTLETWGPRSFRLPPSMTSPSGAPVGGKGSWLRRAVTPGCPVAGPCVFALPRGNIGRAESGHAGASSPERSFAVAGAGFGERFAVGWLHPPYRISMVLQRTVPMLSRKTCPSGPARFRPGVAAAASACRPSRVPAGQPPGTA